MGCQWTVSEVAQLKLTGSHDCGKLDRNCYRRLQILFQSSVSDEGFLSVLPQTLVFVIHSLYPRYIHKSSSCVPLLLVSTTGCFLYEMEYSRNVNVIPLLMEIGDRVQTLNTLCPITGEIVDMYKNYVTIADDDAETVDQLLSFHADDLEVGS